MSNPRIARYCRKVKIKCIIENCRRRLQEMGLRYCKAKRKSHINQFNMKRRLAFAKKYVNMPLSFWRKIIWSNKSKFELKQLKNKDCVRRKRNEAYKKPFIISTVKFGGGSLMV